MSIAESIVDSYEDDIRGLITHCEENCMEDFYDDIDGSNFKFIDGSVVTVKLLDDYIQVETYS